MAKQSTAPVAVQAGHVRIGDRLSVEAALPSPVAVRRGQPVAIELPFQLHEASADKESFHVSLQCTVAEAGSPRAPEARKAVVEEWQDHWGRRDDRDGVLRDLLTLEPGDYAVEFTIQAAYIRGPWRSGRLDQRDVRRAAGAVRLRVA